MIVRLSGGLGNQFFQYAFGRAYAEKTGERLDLDTWSFHRDKLRNYELDNYNIKKGKKRFWRRVFCNIVWELKTHIETPKWIENVVKVECEQQIFTCQKITKKDVYAVGFWQNEHYFADIKEILQKEFVYKGNITENQKKVIEEMESENSIAMHIRRGDYVTPTCQRIYVNLDKDYYLKALQHIRNNLQGCSVYVFSDDIEWCKQEYADIEGVRFIDSAISSSPHIDIELMRHCKHFILANSTFSWWGAYLAEHNDKHVVAPKNWFVNERTNKILQNALLKNCYLI